MTDAGGSGGTEGASRRDWTTGSITRSLWSLSWPMAAQNSLYMVAYTIDMIWVGRLGAASIAGAGVAGIIFMLTVTAKVGLIQGVRAMVARFIGARDTDAANHVARQGFIISAAYGLAMTAIGVLFAEPLLRLFGLEADVVAEGVAYMQVIFAGWVTMSFYMITFSIMQASGDVITPMRITLFIRAVHVALCPCLVFGWWIFPSLGVSGAALTNVVAQSLGMLLGLWVLFGGRTRLRLSFRNFHPDRGILWRILKIGIPACVMGVQRSFAGLVLTRLMVPFGTLAVAAHSLVQRIDMPLSMPGQGLGWGAAVLVGQNLGAHQPEQAERTGWVAAGLVQGFMVICSVVILLWAENVVHIFTAEPDLVAITSVFLRIAVAGYLAQGFTAALQNSISGAGDTLPPMLVSLVTTWIVQIPLAFLLPQVADLGAYGVRWAIVSGTVLGMAAFITYFRMGRWKHKRV